LKTAIRPLTLAERRKPAQNSNYGGFKNVSFQIGEIVLPVSDVKNLNNQTAGFTKANIKKTEKIQLPVLIPHSMGVLPGTVNTVASVMGVKNQDNTYDAMLVARTAERLSSFNTTLRTVTSLIEAEPEAEDTGRLGKSFSARVHNQVMLAGVVVGASYEDGENPRFHIQLRQDDNKENIIPLTYEARNASAMVSRVKYGAMIYVDGEFAFRKVPVRKMDEKGNPMSKDGKPVFETEENGDVKQRLHTYIRITAPKAPAEFDIDFGKTPPKWIIEMAQELNTRRPARKEEAKSDGAPKEDVFAKY
jgi:hypothetical protein